MLGEALTSNVTGVGPAPCHHPPAPNMEHVT